MLWLERKFALAVESSGAAMGAAPIALLQHVIGSTCVSDDFNKACTELIPHIKAGTFSTLEECHLIARLSQAGIRREDLLTSCLWRVFKSTAGLIRSESNTKDLATATSVAFCCMTNQGFVDDLQLISIALGRCIELSEHFSINDIANVYRGLHALQLQHFTIGQVPLAEGMGRLKPGDAGGATTSFEEAPTDNQLIFQPNLIDIVTSSLEKQLVNWIRSQGLPASKNCGSLILPGQLAGELTDWSDLPSILRSMSFLGVHESETIRSLGACLASGNQFPVQFLVSILDSALKIDARPVDLLYHEERRVEVLAARDVFIKHVAARLSANQGLLRRLDQEPQSVLSLRRLFESSSSNLWELAPSLWNVVRSVHVSHKLTVDLQNNRIDKNWRKGVLFSKTKPPQKSKAQPATPPQFKKWHSAVSDRRAKRTNPQKSVKRTKFGVRRISPNYIQSKVKKYCPANR